MQAVHSTAFLNASAAHVSARVAPRAPLGDLVLPALPFAIASSGAAFSKTEQAAVQGAIAHAYGELSLGPVSLATETAELFPGLLLEESFNGSVVQYSLVPPQAYKRPVLERLVSALEPGLANVMDGGVVINICPGTNNKYRVMCAFAERYGLGQSSVAKFGDNAGVLGNDTHVRGRNSYNVGFDESADCSTVTTPGKGPDGFLQGLCDLEKKGVGIAAIATDLDRTLTHGDGVIDPRAMQAIVDFLESFGRVVIMTGRGVSAVRICADALQRIPCSVLGLAHLELSLFNGAASVTFC